MRKVISIICALALMLGCVSASAVTFSESKLAEIQGNGSAIAPNTVLASEDFDGYGGPITDSNSSPNRCEDKLSASTTSNFTWGNNSHGSSYTQTNGNAENCNFQYNAFKAVGGTSRHIETLTFNSPINSGVVEWSFSFRVTSNQSGKKLNITKAPNYNSLIKFDSGKIYVNGSETAEEYTYTNTKKANTIKIIISILIPDHII